MAFETDVRHVVTMHHSDFSPVFPTQIHAKMTRFYVASLCLSVLLLFALESIEAFEDDFQYGWVSIFFEQRLYLLSFFLSSLKLIFAVYNRFFLFNKCKRKRGVINKKAERIYQVKLLILCLSSTVVIFSFKHSVI